MRMVGRPLECFGGRTPVVLESTGVRGRPDRQGRSAARTVEEAAEAIERTPPTTQHTPAALALACEHSDSDKIRSRMLAEVVCDTLF